MLPRLLAVTSGMSWGVFRQAGILAQGQIISVGRITMLEVEGQWVWALNESLVLIL